MKKTMIFVLATLFATVTFAQQQLATLNHNDSITVYYGISALQQAHTAAVNGDIITLSSGVFDPVNITKAVTIRGAGAWVDSLGNQTTLRSAFTINVPNDSAYHLTLEGLYVNDLIYFWEVHNPQFIKCQFNDFRSRHELNNTNCIMRNATFINCILNNWKNHDKSGGPGTSWDAENTFFYNSVILNSDQYSYKSPDVFYNCILKQDPNVYNITRRLFVNSILFYSRDDNSNLSGNSSTAYNCLFVQTSTSSNSPDLFSSSFNHVLWNSHGMNTVFRNWQSTDLSRYELQDSIAATCLGNDGSQIGIYGGSIPFDPRVTNPIIKRINVAQRSTADGKLAVDIEVVSDEE